MSDIVYREPLIYEVESISVDPRFVNRFSDRGEADDPTSISNLLTSVANDIYLSYQARNGDIDRESIAKNLRIEKSHLGRYLQIPRNMVPFILDLSLTDGFGTVSPLTMSVDYAEVDPTLLIGSLWVNQKQRQSPFWRKAGAFIEPVVEGTLQDEEHGNRAAIHVASFGVSKLCVVAYGGNLANSGPDFAQEAEDLAMKALGLEVA